MSISMVTSDSSPSQDLDQRRRSWTTLGAAALLAALALPSSGKMAKASKKTKKLKNKKCKRQVDECIASLDKACQNDPACEANIPCCDFFGTCNAEVALACIFSN
jgi:hypothetical protein